MDTELIKLSVTSILANEGELCQILSHNSFVNYLLPFYFIANGVVLCCLVKSFAQAAYTPDLDSERQSLL